MTPEQRAAFEALAHPLIEWVAQNLHPHHTVVLDATHAELLEGIAAVHTTEYLVD